MRLWIAALLALTATTTATAASAAEPLELVCYGEAIKNEAQQTFGSAYNSRGESVSANATTYRKQRSNERLRLKMDGAGAAQIKLPPNLIPPLHSGGADNWWPVSDLAVTDSRISGSYRLNVLNKGHFEIDRRTGDIDAKALAMRFSGACEKAAEAPDERKF